MIFANKFTRPQFWEQIFNVLLTQPRFLSKIGNTTLYFSIFCVLLWNVYATDKSFTRSFVAPVAPNLPYFAKSKFIFVGSGGLPGGGCGIFKRSFKCVPCDKNFANKNSYTKLISREGKVVGWEGLEAEAWCSALEGGHTSPAHQCPPSS